MNLLDAVGLGDLETDLLGRQTRVEFTYLSSELLRKKQSNKKR